MMRYKLLGRSGLRVAELVLGTMTFGEDWGWGADKATSQAMFERYAEAGGNFIDTANRYTNGTAETLVGEFIAADRDHFVLATKYSLFTQHGDPNFSGNHRKNMMQAVEASLKRLNTSYIDVYWLHMWDYTTPIDEVMRGLDDLVSSGKILYIGISDTPAWVVARANMLAELRGWAQFVALQVPYSLLRRDVERELLPMARSLDLAVTPWGLLHGGVLTGKYLNGKPSESTRLGNRELDEKEEAVVRKVVQIAEELGVTPTQVATNWIRQQNGVILPIIGARTLAQLDDALGVLDFSLSAEHVAALNEVSHLELGFPVDFYHAKDIKNLIFGGTFDQLDNHRTIF